MCNIYDVAVADMGRYSLVIKEVDDNQDMVHGKIKMNLFVKGLPRATFSNKPKGLLTVDSNHTLSCDVVSYPVKATVVDMQFRKCAKLSNCLGADKYSLPLSPSQESVSPEQSPFSSVSSVTLGHASGWSDGVVICEACNQMGCDRDEATFLLGDLPG